MMLRQHFEMIARVLLNTEMPAAVRKNLAESFAHELVSTNSHFDRDRFVQSAMTQESPLARGPSMSRAKKIARGDRGDT
jgi:hypothetical protein